MADQLEKFIRNNREAFDDKSPSKKVWQNIETSLSPKSYTIWWKVAAVFFFVTSAFLTYKNYAEPDISTNELVALESFYFTQIDYKYALINEHISHKSQAGLEQELQKLDAMYKVLKEEWQKKPSKEVLEALTLNLLVRLDILNRQLEMLDQPENNSERRI